MNAKNGWSTIGRLALILPLGLAFSGGTWADENDPSSRVARLAYEEGSVSLQPGGVDDWVAAPVNRPLTTGDKLWSDQDSRAELQLDGSLLRLSDHTAVSFLNLNDRTTQVQLTSGTLIVNVRRLDDDETYEIDTPNLAFSVLRPGRYRISVDDSGANTTIAVRDGQGEVTGGGTAYPVRSNEQDVFTGTDSLAEQAGPYGQGGAPFDAWSAGRDDRWEHSASARYVSPDVVGYQDLDNAGTWNSTPEYGNVWFPRGVQAGWAPYHDGHWAYVAPWGYTWVDDQPWGFAPFHYGRWISVNGAWGWVPSPPRPEGAVYVRPVYAPALVAWVGVGAGIAWFALGPREVYVPSYPVSQGYMSNINVSNTNVNRTVVNNVYNSTVINKTNVTNVTNITNVTYVNRNVPGAVAATTSQAFANAQPVSKNVVRFDPHAAAPVRAFAPTAVPTKQAVLGSGRVNAARPPAAVQTRAVVARTAPPPPAPKFERLQQAIQQNGGRPVSVAATRQIQTAAAPRTAQVRIAPPATLGVAHPPGAAGTARPESPPGARPGDRPAAANAQPGRPPAANNEPARPGDRPAAANAQPGRPSAANNEPARPADRPAAANAQPGRPPATNTEPARPADRPAAAHAQPGRPPAASNEPARPPAVPVHPNENPATFKPPSPSGANSALERQHLQQQQQLRAQQEEERQRVQQQQEAEHQQLARQQGEQAQKDKASQQLEQKHQQQTQALAQKHTQQQEQLQRQQQEERQKQEGQTKPPVRKDDRPPNAGQ